MFILFPALGLLFQPLGEDGVEWSSVKLYFNLYTGPGFLGAILSIINILMVIFLFKEYNLHGVKKRLRLKRLWQVLVDKCIYMESRAETKPLLEDENEGNQVDIKTVDSILVSSLPILNTLVFIVMLPNGYGLHVISLPSSKNFDLHMAW